MRRVLFHCRGRPVHSYPVFLYLGIVLGTCAQLVASTASNLDPTRVLVATAILVATALLGSRLLYVASHWSLYRTRKSRILGFGVSGSSLYGGLILALPVSFLVLPALNLPFAAYWDGATFNMLIGLAVTRIGCFLNGCCVGRYTTGWLAVNAPDHRGVWRRRVPTQALEASLAVVIVIALLPVRRQAPFDGAIFLLALSLYASGRLLLEPLRERPDRIGALRLHQGLSAAFLAVAIAGLIVAWA